MVFSKHWHESVLWKVWGKSSSLMLLMRKSLEGNLTVCVKIESVHAISPPYLRGFCIWGFNQQQIENIWKKKFPRVLKSKTWTSHALATIYTVFTFCWVLEVIYRWLNIYRKMCLGYMQILHHFIKGLECAWILVHKGVLEPSPVDTKGQM